LHCTNARFPNGIDEVACTPKISALDSSFVIAGEFAEGCTESGDGSFSSNSVSAGSKKVQAFVSKARIRSADRRRGLTMPALSR
jgi:hypothetical protein